MTIYQITVRARNDDGNEYRNVVHYETSFGVMTLAEIQEAVDDLDGKYKTRLQSLYSDLVTFYEYGVRVVDIASQPETTIVPTAGTWAGTGANNMLPSQSCAVVTWKAPSAFPRTTRTYFFPFTEANNDLDGLPNAAAVTALGLFGTDVLELVLAAQNDPDKVAVKFTGSPPVVTSNNNVTVAKVSPSWGTQRRRRPGVGI